MFTINELFFAYRKLKGQCYYESSTLNLRLLIAQWESKITKGNIASFNDLYESFSGKTKKLLDALNSDNNSEYINLLLDQIKYRYELKSIKSIEQTPSGYFSNLPNDSFVLGECNYLIDAPVEIHLLSVLWILRLNRYIENKKLYENNYANLIEEDSISPYDDFKRISEHGFKINVCSPYYYGYKKWRDNAMEAACNLLKNRKNTSIVSLDIRRFYYSVRLRLDDLLTDVSQRGYIKRGYAHDDDLKKLTNIIQKINIAYTELITPIVREMDLEDIRPCYSLLPLGLLSSGVIANLYLTRLDESIKKKCDCKFYGRYVDDMLFVFEGLAEQGENPIERFLDNHFVKNHLLFFNEEKQYKISEFPNLNIQKEKIILQDFRLEGSLSEINSFKKRLLERSSDFRFLMDDEMADKEFDISTHLVDNYDFNTVNEGLSALRNNKLAATQFLSQKMNLAEKSTYAKDEEEEACQKILDFFCGNVCLEYLTMWEKVASFFVVKNRFDYLNKYISRIKKLINNLQLDSSEKTLVDIDSLSNQLKERLYLSLAMPFALNPKAIKKTVLNQEESRKVRKYSIDFRQSNLFRHNRLGTCCINFSSVLFDKKTDLFKFQIYNPILKEKIRPNVQWWLSPRLVPFSEFSSIALIQQINNSDNNCSLDLVPKWAYYYYRRINLYYSLIIPNFPQETPFFSIKKGTPICQVETYDNRLSLEKETSDKVNVGVVNLKVQKEDFYRSIRSRNSNLSIIRKRRLNKVLRDSQSIDQKSHILVLPELSVPIEWMDVMIEHARVLNMALVFGLEYVTHNNIVYNIVMTILPVRLQKNSKDCLVIPRIKNYYSPNEKNMINLSKKSIPNITPKYYHPFHWRKTYFTVYNCFEMAEIRDRSIFKGKVDLVIATEYNKDLSFYSNLMGSWTRDLHCFIVQVNSSQYGDSRVMQPTEQKYEKKVFVKGGSTPVVIIEPLDIKWLRDGQLIHIQNYNNAPYKRVKILKDKPNLKPTPPDFSEDDVMIRINDKSFNL